MTQPLEPTPQTGGAGIEARRAALDILERVAKGASLDDALKDCRTFDLLEGPDRGFARALASCVLRRRGSLDHVLGAYIDRPLPKRAIRVMDILRLASAQTLFMGTPDHAAVSTAVSLAGERRENLGYAKLVNAVARKVAKNGPAVVKKLPARVDTPGWLWRSWERAYGAQTARAIAEAHHNEPRLDVTLKAPGAANEWTDRLEAELLPTGSLRRAGVSDVTQLAGFEEGAWWVQDAAASLPARLAGDVSGKTVFDLCAAPGGKTLQFAAMGANVTAVDISEPRLERLVDNLARTNLTARLVTEDILKWRSEEKADIVLLDAPCSATGTIRRHPDIPWTKSETDIAALTSLQARMLDHAIGFVKPGGMVIYCVCSLQPEEGEKQAEAALARHKHLARKPVLPEEIGGLAGGVNRYGDLRTTPAMLAEAGAMDGFFAARFIVND